MSDVTDLLVTCELMDDGVYAELVRWFARAGGNVAQLTRVDDEAMGPKACQAVVAIAAVNYWSTYEKGFLAKIARLKWRFPDAVRVFVHTERGDSGFRPLGVKPGEATPRG